MFQAGTLDYTPISAGMRPGSPTTEPWDLRSASSFALGRVLRVQHVPAPFNDVHVRRAFELGIDWKRLVALLSNPLVVPATGMVPVGVPGHSATDFGPALDLTTAKAELAAAGYPNGVGFPHITLRTGGQRWMRRSSGSSTTTSASTSATRRSTGSSTTSCC